MSTQRCTHGGAPCPRMVDVVRLEERVPFDVTDPHRDAPDGAILDLTDDGRPGHWQRAGDRWEPLTPEELETELERQYEWGYL